MNERKLLLSITKKDFEVQTFYSGGPGGQNQNKRETGVRIIHKASGAVGESREHRTQQDNKKAALKRLAENPHFKVWLSRVVFEITNGKTIDEMVDESMKPELIKVEVKDENGRWVEAS